MQFLFPILLIVYLMQFLLTILLIVYLMKFILWTWSYVLQRFKLML